LDHAIPGGWLFYCGVVIPVSTCPSRSVAGKELPTLYVLAAFECLFVPERRVGDSMPCRNCSNDTASSRRKAEPSTQESSGRRRAGYPPSQMLRKYSYPTCTFVILTARRLAVGFGLGRGAIRVPHPPQGEVGFVLLQILEVSHRSPAGSGQEPVDLARSGRSR
jgi:hypothetical protein